MRSPGRALDGETRDYFEPRFGEDFSDVRIHTGGEAEASAAEVDAEAYTVGRSIVFGAGFYRPATPDGRRLLAHELTHVVQQRTRPQVLARRPSALARADAATVPEALDRAEALQVIRDELSLATSTEDAALRAIENTLRMPFTAENARLRMRKLAAAISLLPAEDALRVSTTLKSPSSPRQKELQDRFQRLDRRSRQALLGMLEARAAPGAAPEPAVQEATAPTSRWSKVTDGVFAYRAAKGQTLASVAQRVSGYDGLPAVLAEINGTAPEKPLPAATLVIVPAEYIARPEALAEIPQALRIEILQTQTHKGEEAAYKRFVRVKSGHPAGPNVFGPAPLLGSLLPTGVLPKLKYFGGLLVGLGAGALEAVKELFVGAWDLIKTLFKTIWNLITGDIGAIVAMVEGWIAQLKLLWANRADIAADLKEKWDAKDDWDRGRFRGEVIGWVMMTALITIVTFGEGALVQISGKWAAVAKLLNITQKAGELGTFAKAFASAGGKAVQIATDALKASRLAKVAEVGAVIAAPIRWTAAWLKKAMGLPGRIADQLTDALAERLQGLSPYVDRVKSLSDRAKRWIFGCRSPCRWDPDFARGAMDLSDGDIEARAIRDLGAEHWDIDDTGDFPVDTPVRVDPRARGYAIEDLHMGKIEVEGYEPLPDWFKTHDAIRGGTRRTVMEDGKRITVVSRPDAISIKSTQITDPARLTEKVDEYLELLRGRFGHTRGGVRVEGVRNRRLDLVFEEGARITPELVRALDKLKRAAGSIDFRWFVMQSGKHVPGARYLSGVIE